eukprot:6372059-Pyramimonas_sp.AAC.2
MAPLPNRGEGPPRETPGFPCMSEFKPRDGRQRDLLPLPIADEFEDDLSCSNAGRLSRSCRRRCHRRAH